MDRNQFEQILSHSRDRILDENYNRLLDKKASAFSGVEYKEPAKKITEEVDSNTANNIRESFSKMPPLTVAPGDPIPDISPIGMALSGSKLLETKTPNVSYQAPVSNTNGVDYTIIKAIVNECIQSNIESLKKVALNESTNMNKFVGMKMGDGNKIQFIDNKGNLYEGVLKFKKKLTKN